MHNKTHLSGITSIIEYVAKQRTYVIENFLHCKNPITSSLFSISPCHTSLNGTNKSRKSMSAVIAADCNRIQQGPITGLCVARCTFIGCKI